MHEANVQKGRDALSRTTDEFLMTTNWRLLAGEQVVLNQPRHIVLRDTLNHLAHHRGQVDGVSAAERPHGSSYLRPVCGRPAVRLSDRCERLARSNPSANVPLPADRFRAQYRTSRDLRAARQGLSEPPLRLIHLDEVSSAGQKKQLGFWKELGGSGARRLHSSKDPSRRR